MNFNLSKLQHRVLLLFMIVISYYVGNSIKSISDYFHIESIFIELPGFFGIFGGLLWLFDKYCWKRPLFRFFKIIEFPNISGKYKGIFTSSYVNPETGNKYTGDVELDIKQTSSNVFIYGKFNQSKSISTQAKFGFNDIEQKLSLYYFYKNKPTENATETMHSHEGSCILTYDENVKFLKGEYYSGRDRNNFGDLSLEKI